MSTSDRGARSGRAAALIALLLAATTPACASVTIHGEVAHPVTRDGWKLTVERYQPPPGVARKRRPLILCHGVLANHRFFEIEGDASLPIVLARAGWDVWLMDMRGRPDAGSPGYFFGEHTYDYSLDDIARDDVDAVVSYVLARTGARDVAWVGHSLGGMIAYAHLGTTRDPRIGALVTVASPGFFAPVSRNLLRFYELSGALSILPALPARTGAAVEGATGLPLAPAALRDIVFAEGNIPSSTYRRLEQLAINDASIPELRQFLLGLRRNEFVSADGRVSYTEALRNVDVPALLIVGRADELADPLVGRGVYERLASKDKQLVIAGRSEGFSTDFGHVDLLVGPAAQREIYPRIVAWLEGHDAR